VTFSWAFDKCETTKAMIRQEMIFLMMAKFISNGGLIDFSLSSSTNISTLLKIAGIIYLAVMDCLGGQQM